MPNGIVSKTEKAGHKSGGTIVSQNRGKRWLGKNDLKAMIFAGLLVFLPLAAVVLGLFVLLAFLFLAMSH